MKYVMILLLLTIVVVSACAKISTSQVACTEEAKICNDGTSVVRDGNNNCEFPACPDMKIYVSEDVEKCKLIRYTCTEGQKPFFDDVGCGCEPINITQNEEKLQAIECAERTQACTKEYVPVCGRLQIQCVTTPCDPLMQTFANKCIACANPLTISYTKGACEKNAAGGTVLVGTKEEQCVNIGGTWTGYDCTGIDANQCQEIGGTFNECASACRNDPTAEMCTLQCVQVCEL